MGLRHEYKLLINQGDRQVIRGRLKALGLADPNAPRGEYLVRSLYFDDLRDTALRQKLDGVDGRDKFRIRYYDGDPSFIRLEKKSKRGGLCSKRGAALSRAQAEAVLRGEAAFLMEMGDPLLAEFYSRLRAGLKPVVVVDYLREPFVYAPGNVRVTIDRDIRTGLYARNLFAPGFTTVPAESPAQRQAVQDVVLEIKYGAFLPDVIRQAVQVGPRPVTAFSKYAQCRRFG